MPERALPLPAEAPQLRLLGAPAWRASAQAAWRPLPRKDAALMALLALEGPQPRPRVAGLLWPDAEATRAQANLRQRLFRLRQAGPPLIDESDAQVALAAGLACDLLQPPPPDPTQAAEWCAPLLGHASYDPDGAALAEWVEAARAGWLGRLPARLADLAAGFENAGALAAAIAACEQQLRLDPLREHAWRHLMRLHHRRGDRGAAVAAFERAERCLRDELGLRPAPETLALLADVEAAAPAPAPARPPPLPPGLLRPPRLVGRQTACEAMHRAWDEACPFLLTGHAGVGKTRLLDDWATARPGTVRCAAVPGDDATACGLVVRLLQAVRTAGHGPAPGALPRGVRRELARLLPDIGPAPQGPGHPALLQQAVLAWLQAAAGAGLGALLLDDLQHADIASLQGLPALVAGTPGLRWGLACRPAAAGAPPLADWARGSGRLRVVPLEGLDEPALAELLASLAPSVPAAWSTLDPAHPAPGLARRLVLHCGGNPLFVLETLRALHARGDGPDAAAPLPQPPGVERLLDDRLAALSPDARALAQVAAVADHDLDAELAAQVLGRPPSALAEPWAELESAQVLIGTRLAHHSLAEAVRRSLSAPLHAPLHGRVARALAARGAPPQQVAQHHAEAGEWAAAGQFALQAARQAWLRGRREAEVALAGQAAAWFERGGDAAAAYRARVSALEAMARHAGLDAARDEAVRLAPLAPDPAAHAALCVARVQLELLRGDGAAAAAQAEAGLATAADPDTRLRLQLGRAAGLAIAGDHARARQLAEPLRPQLPASARPGLPAPQAQHDALRACELWDLQAQVDHYTGRTRDCLDATGRLLEAARAAGHVEAELDALGTLTGLYDLMGRGAEAIATGRAARTLHARLGEGLVARAQDLNLAYALFGSGHWGEALGLMEATRDYAVRTAPGSLLDRASRDMLADLWLAAGQPARALAERAALAADPQADTPARRDYGADVQARAALQLGDFDAARTLWAPLAGRAGEPVRGVLDLRLRCHASQALGAAEARRTCEHLLAWATAQDLPVPQALARLHRGLSALRAGDVDAAARDADTLLQQLEGPTPLRHGYLDPLQVCALAAHAGLQARAEPLARAWCEATLVPNAPPAWRARLADDLAARRAAWRAGLS